MKLPMRENQLHALTNHQQTPAEEKVCYVLCGGVSYSLLYLIYSTLTYTLELSTPVCSGEVRRWSHGAYTLLHDGEAAQAEFALDLVLPFGCAGLCPTTTISLLSHSHQEFSS